MQKFFEKYPVMENTIAVGVSGGADSLALVLRLNDWGKLSKVKIVALTVDHALRQESAAEAQYVAKIMTQEGIEHHILLWQGEKPLSGIEEAARIARYDLIKKWCQENNVKILATGHHQKDQAETFILRLIRGSGLYGLSGILPISNRDGLTIIRPQLEENSEDLKKYLISRKIKWVEDPSNQNEDFVRVKIRKFLPVLEKELMLSEKRLAETAKVLSLTRAFVEDEVQKVINNQVLNFDNYGVAIPYTNIQAWHGEIAYLVLAELLKKIGGNIYAPEASEIIALIERIKRADFKGCTLGYCEVLKFQKQIWIVPELKIKEKISKQKWVEFVLLYPRYANLQLPYKLKINLMKNLCS